MRDAELGEMSIDRISEFLSTSPLTVPLLGGMACRFLFEGVGATPVPENMRLAVRRMLEAPASVLREAEPYVVRYCEEICSLYEPEESPAIVVREPSEIWSHVRFGSEFVVSERSEGDAEDGVYLSLECNCDWEVEHGLQLVFREGRAVTKVSSFDGHLTNSDAYNDRSLAHVVYRSIR